MKKEESLIISLYLSILNSNKMVLKEKYLQFIPPFTMMVSGPSCSGKTNLIRRILKNHKTLIPSKKPFLTVLWIYGQYQEIYKEEIPNVRLIYHKGLPEKEKLLKYSPDIVVIDDLMNEVSDDKKFRNLFTKGSHHLNLNVIFITQNLFQMRNIHLNSHYLILMRNPRDASQIDVLGRQMKISKQLSEAYNDATSKPYGYLVIDLKQETPREFMLRTQITPEETIKREFEPIIYKIK